MKDFDVRTEGFPELIRALDETAREVADLDVFRKIAEEGARLVAHDAPHRTGKLASSVTAGWDRMKSYVAVEAPYSGVINWGWPSRHITPSYFMQKADEAWQPMALRDVQEAIDGLISKKRLK